MLAIAIAQYQPPESKGSTFADPLSTILDGIGPTSLHWRISSFLRVTDDSDEEIPDLEEEGDYSEHKEINFTDITARPSPVRTEVPANKMLQACSLLLSADEKCIVCNPLRKTIIEDDLVYELAVALDRPDMVDEIIRHPGVRIPIPSDTKKSPTKFVEERVYLGLKVGGKRRADIIQQKQTHKTITHNFALLYNAISSGATRVVEYLAGPRPHHLKHMHIMRSLTTTTLRSS